MRRSVKRTLAGMAPPSKEEAGFVLPPPVAPPHRRAPRAAETKPDLRPRKIKPPSAPSVPPPPSQPVMWRVPDEAALGYEAPIPASSGVRAREANRSVLAELNRTEPNREPHRTEPRASRPAPPPPPSRAARVRVASSSGRSEAAAITTYAPAAVMRAPVPQEPLVQVRPPETMAPVVLTPPPVPVILPPVAAPALLPLSPVLPTSRGWHAMTQPMSPDRWADSWSGPSDSLPPMVMMTPSGSMPRRVHPTWLRSASVAFACLLSLVLGLTVAFVVFLGSAKLGPPLEASAARSAQLLADRASDDWEDSRRDSDDASKDDASKEREPDSMRETPASRTEAEQAEAPEAAPAPRARAVAPAPKARKEKAAPKSEPEPAAEEEKTKKEAKSGPGGTININSLPSAHALVDGRPVGNTPVMGLPVDAGPHTVTFIHPKYGKASVSVRVSPGQRAVAAHRFPFRRNP